MKWLIVILFFPSLAFASKEGVLALKTFHVTSNGIGDSEDITVQGEADEKGKLKTLTVRAFKKVFEAPKDFLKWVPFENKNLIQISYSGGYPQLGGRTIYIVFKNAISPEKVDGTTTIVLTENGKFEMK